MSHARSPGRLYRSETATGLCPKIEYRVHSPTGTGGVVDRLRVMFTLTELLSVRTVPEPASFSVSL